ncbi:DUF4123 domain-containing protein [Vibrio paucivorans]|uniref:DUF4123 domain-containing protein n=1 Tax=Vibrio paucivorans TaxID=2829489 RepID=A0A9X3HRT9_9VIBR|nr:DUF4123 domain-containing protein [Vibrio paucivorans]MCW8334211.1 DUF4123 domain-containing protein [Vibrio paucivorans]
MNSNVSGQRGFWHQIAANKGQKLYLIVDGAQIEHLAKALYNIEGQINLEPIYMSPPYDQLISVSPYVIEVTAQVKDWFFNLNNPMSGYFISSAKPLSEVCDGFRQVALALSPYGSQVLVKLAHSECAWVFFSTDCPMFWEQVSAIWVLTRSGWMYKEAPDHLKSDSKHILRISDVQWSLLGNIAWKTTLERAEVHMFKWFHQVMHSLDSPSQWIEQHAQFAYSKGFTTERDLFLYLNIIGYLGEEEFLDRALHPKIHSLLEETSIQTPSQRIEVAAELAYQHFTQNKNLEEQA